MQPLQEVAVVFDAGARLEVLAFRLSDLDTAGVVLGVAELLATQEGNVLAALLPVPGLAPPGFQAAAPFAVAVEHGGDELVVGQLVPGGFCSGVAADEIGSSSARSTFAGSTSPETGPVNVWLRKCCTVMSCV